MIRCAIIDDATFAIDVLESHISKTFNLELVFSSTDPREGFKFISENSIDLLFLDIQMPQISGLDLIGQLPKNLIVIFTTAYEEYALSAFEKGAAGYMLKPISYDRFQTCLSNINFNNLTKNDSFFIKDGRSRVKILLKEINYIESKNGMLCYYMNNGKYHLSNNSFPQIEPFIHEPKFIKVSKNVIVSFDSIISIEPSSVSVLFCNIVKTFSIGEIYKKSINKYLDKITINN